MPPRKSGGVARRSDVSTSDFVCFTCSTIEGIVVTVIRLESKLFRTYITSKYTES
jgi:hypothetical protein